MPITAKCLIPTVGMLLKHSFRGTKKKPKNATFFVLYSAKRICEKYKMAAEKISKTGPAGHP
jgi:hypothetical protein